MFHSKIERERESNVGVWRRKLLSEARQWNQRWNGNRSRSQTDKCICAIDGQILFPRSSLIVNFEIVYPIDSRPSASGSKRSLEYLPGRDRLVLEIAPLFAPNSARNSIVIERDRLSIIKSNHRIRKKRRKRDSIGIAGRKCIFSSFFVLIFFLSFFQTSSLPSFSFVLIFFVLEK